FSSDTRDLHSFPTRRSSDLWAVHYAAADFAARGRDVIDLTIGNPDVAAPDDLLECAVAAMRAGRTQYSTGRGEPALRAALAARYAARAGRPEIGRASCRERAWVPVDTEP